MGGVTSPNTAQELPKRRKPHGWSARTGSKQGPSPEQHRDSYLEGAATRPPGVRLHAFLSDGPQGHPLPERWMKTLAFREIKPLGWAVPPEWEGVSELAPACHIPYQGDRCSDHTYSLHQHLPGLFSHLQDSAEEVRRVIQRAWKVENVPYRHSTSPLQPQVCASSLVNV